jgi:hypothetical protein
VLDLDEIPLLVRAEVAQTLTEEVQAQTHLTQEEEVAEVEVLETKNIFISQICKNEKNLTFHLMNISTRF